MLSFHAGCKIIGMQQALFVTDCRARKGASGGAVTQLNTDTGEFELTGVISQGDSADVSLFVPTERFVRDLRKALGMRP